MMVRAHQAHMDSAADLGELGLLVIAPPRETKEVI